MKFLGYTIMKARQSDEPKSKVVAGKNPDLYAHVGKIESLTPNQLRSIYFLEPLVFKAINKKNRDTFQSGFVIKRRDGGVPFKGDLEVITDFMASVRLLSKLELGGKSKDIYGDGFVEKIYMEPANRSPDMPPSKGARPIGLKVLDAECIQEMKPKKEGVRSSELFYVYRKTGADDVYIHPDRVIHIRDGLPNSVFGYSKISILRNILKSKMNVDLAVGEILDWSSHGILDMTITNATVEQEKHMIKLFKEGNHFYVHDEAYELDVKNPTMGEPKSYFEFMYVNVAAVFMMPTHILTGIQPGHVIGSEIGVADYHKDLANDQSMIYTPLIEDLLQELLESMGKKWSYEVVWSPTFVDELSEGKIMEKRALAAKEGYINRILGQKEARKVMKDGVIDINPEVIPDDIKKDEPSMGGGPSLPNISPTGTKNEQKAFVIRPLTERQRQMIADMAEKERQLGEEILKEQEKL